MRKADFDKSSHPLGQEIAQEAASNLGRLGRALERALDDLRAFDSRRALEGGASAVDRRARQALVKRAATALWHYVVQREAIGLRDADRMMRDYAVPADVRHRMGIVGGD